MEMLKMEKEIMNMYVTENPVKPYMPQISDNTNYNVSQLQELDHNISSGTFGGMISDVSTMRTRRGKLMSKFKIEDTTGYVEAVCFNHEKFVQQIVEDNIVLVKGKFERGDRGNQIVAYEVIPLILDLNYRPKKQGFAKREIKPFELVISENDISETNMSRMNRTFQNNFGVQDVFLSIKKNDGKTIRAQMPFKVDSETGNLKPQLQSIFKSAFFV